MSITHRVKRLLGVSLAGAMVLALMPAGIAAAQVVDVDDVDACEGSAGLVDFNDNLGFFESEIECMAAYGITLGDSDGNYRPGDTVTRQEMAAFIARFASQAQFGDIDSIPESTDDAFDDIANSFARDAINWLADLEITVGTEGGDSFEPQATMTRQQMASFIARAHVVLGVDLPDASDADAFGDTDDIADVHTENVLILHAAGVVEGDTAGNYNPTAPVTRGQMSAFIVRSIGVLDSQGLWNGVFVVEPDVESNQSYLVTPTDEAINTVSTLAGQDSDRGVRSYSATVGNVTAVDVALIPAGNVTVDGDGVVSFADSNPAQASNRADDLGITDAFITTVNGVSTSGTPALVNNVTPNNGEITFSINSTDANVAVIPVVFSDDDNNNQLNLDADDLPSEDFGIGGTKTWFPADAVADTYFVNSRIVRADLDTFSAEGTRLNGANGEFTFSYDSDDTFEYDSIVAITGFTINMSDFEEWHSGSLNADGTQRANSNTTGDDLLGDDLEINYNPNLTSTFKFQRDEPNAPTDINAQPGTVAGATLSVTWTAPTNPNMFTEDAVYQIWRAPVTDSGVGTYVDIDIIDAIDANEDPVEQYNDSDSALEGGETYAYRVVPWGAADVSGPNVQGAESAAAQATVPAVDFPQAPVSEVIFIDDNNADGDAGTPDGLLNNGDTLTLVYRNAPIELDSPSITLADNTGTRAVVNSSNANFSVGGLDDEQLIITMTGAPSVTQTMPTPGGSALEIPAAIVAASGISNADAAWSLAESGLDLYSLTGGQEDRVVGTTNGFLSSEVAPADIVANPNSDTVSVLTSATGIDDDDPFTVFDGLGVSIGTGTFDAANGTTITTDGFAPGDRLYFVYDDRDEFGPFGPTNLFASVPSATTIISNPTDVPSIFDVAAEGTGTTDTIQVTWQDDDIPPSGLGSITQVGAADDYQVYDAGNNVLVADGVTATVISSDTVEVTLDADLDVGTSYVLRVPDATVQDPNNLPNVAESVGFTVANADIIAPEVVTDGISGTAGDFTFTVEFTEPLDAASVDDGDFFYSAGMVTGTSLNAANEVVTVTVDTALSAGDTVGVSAGSVQDEAGNAGPSATETFTLPVADAVEMDSAVIDPTTNTIVVTFNQDIGTNGDPSAKFNFADGSTTGSGVDESPTSTAVTASDELTLTFGSNLSPADQGVLSYDTLQGGGEVHELGDATNTMASSTIAALDVTPPALASADQWDDTAAFLTFSEAIDCGFVAATDFEVRVDGNLRPSGDYSLTSCASNDGEIILDFGGAAPGDGATVEVTVTGGSFPDENNNGVTAGSQNYTFIASAGAPVSLSVTATDNGDGVLEVGDVITVRFNEDMTASGTEQITFGGPACGEVLSNPGEATYTWTSLRTLEIEITATPSACGGTSGTYTISGSSNITDVGDSLDWDIPGSPDVQFMIP